MIKHKSQSATAQLPIPVEMIERRIYLIRGHRVMIDTDLAKLYQVPTFRLSEQVKRNHKRFPEDFMFQLTKEEAELLTSQFAMSKRGRRWKKDAPHAFTEQGVGTIFRAQQRALYAGQHCGHVSIRKVQGDFGYSQRPCPRSRGA